MGPLAAAAAEAPRVRRHAVLGKTGLEVSDIGFGANSLGDPTLVHYAMERGINYFDTAEGYRFGGSEEVLGEALVGRRDRACLATKAKIDAGDSRADMMSALETSLRRLRTDYVDVYFNHAMNDVDRMANPEWPEFTSRAKEQGKIRFCGISGHGGNLGDCVEYALDHDLVDVMLLAHNFGQDPAFYQRFLRNLDYVAIQPRLPELMKRARGQGVGVIAMKTLRGARLNDLRAYEREGGTFAQAALRWVLSSGHANSLIVTMRERAHVDEYLGASGETSVRDEDVAILRRYEVLNGESQCRHGCSACTCPTGVPIDEVLRTRMYECDYDNPELARTDYAALAEPASVCASCSHQSCTGTCPFGLPVATLTRDTHWRLTQSAPSGGREARA
jgi:predicted aldo/keto reductase-like oxidoreductase